jgi:hypothetical protein
VDVAKPGSGHFEKSGTGNGYVVADNTNSSLYALFSLLKDGVKAYRLTGAGVEPGTDSVGDYRLKELPPAEDYAVEVEHQGFDKYVRNGLIVRQRRPGNRRGLV